MIFKKPDIDSCLIKPCSTFMANYIGPAQTGRGIKLIMLGESKLLGKELLYKADGGTFVGADNLYVDLQDHPVRSQVTRILAMNAGLKLGFSSPLFERTYNGVNWKPECSWDIIPNTNDSVLSFVSSDLQKNGKSFSESELNYDKIIVIPGISEIENPFEALKIAWDYKFNIIYGAENE